MIFSVNTEINNYLTLQLVRAKICALLLETLYVLLG